MPPPLVLASTSPYRKALLDRLALPYEVAAPGTDETSTAGEAPEALALRLAQEKARAVAMRRPGAVVIGSDQVAALGARLLGKPGSHEAALEQLLACRGREVVFHTALCVIDGPKQRIAAVNVPTTVHYRDYSPEQAERYLRLEQPYDCAGSAKIEGLGIVLIERVESADPTALIGLPLIALTERLLAAGYALPAAPDAQRGA